MLWPILSQLGERLTGRPDAAKVDQKDDRYVTAAFERALDFIVSAHGDALRAGSQHARMLHDRLLRSVNGSEGHALYLAGRLGSLAEVLGLAAQRCAPALFEAELQDGRFAGIIKVLYHRGPQRNVDLAKMVSESEESVCRKLRELKTIGAVIADRRGREVYNALTGAARAALALTPPEKPVTHPARFDMSILQAAPSRLERVVSTQELPQELPRLQAAA